MTRSPRRPSRPAVLLALGVLLLSAAGGCSFDRRWKHLRAQAAADETAAVAAAAADPLAGRWEGTWRSERSNHAGKLRAIVTPVDEATYRADFHATYLGLLRFGYSMDLAAQREGGVTRFQGQENLGRLAGGLYQYDGTTDGQTFDCTYRSKSDHGRFRMTRPATRARR